MFFEMQSRGMFEGRINGSLVENSSEMTTGKRQKVKKPTKVLRRSLGRG
jgi:hypothetical protein